MLPEIVRLARRSREAGRSSKPWINVRKIGELRTGPPDAHTRSETGSRLQLGTYFSLKLVGCSLAMSRKGNILAALVVIGVALVLVSSALLVGLGPFSRSPGTASASFGLFAG